MFDLFPPFMLHQLNVQYLDLGTNGAQVLIPTLGACSYI